jgi:hypothetical protein
VVVYRHDENTRGHVRTSGQAPPLTLLKMTLVTLLKPLRLCKVVLTLDWMADCDAAAASVCAHLAWATLKRPDREDGHRREEVLDGRVELGKTRAGIVQERLDVVELGEELADLAAQVVGHGLALGHGRAARCHVQARLPPPGPHPVSERALASKLAWRTSLSLKLVLYAAKGLVSTAVMLVVAGVITPVLYEAAALSNEVASADRLAAKPAKSTWLNSWLTSPKLALDLYGPSVARLLSTCATTVKRGGPSVREIDIDVGLQLREVECADCGVELRFDALNLRRGVEEALHHGEVGERPGRVGAHRQKLVKIVEVRRDAQGCLGVHSTVSIRNHRVVRGAAHRTGTALARLWLWTSTQTLSIGAEMI